MLDNFSLPFCEMTDIEQPTGGIPKNDTCAYESGYALLSSGAYLFPMFIQMPVRCPLICETLSG